MMHLTEFLGMVLVLAGLLRVYMLFNSNGYLPAPFVFDVADTFMDWFNTAFWAHNGDAYSSWRTIYLPLSFVITGFFGDPRCYGNRPYDARDCDIFGIVFILLMYAGCVLVSWLAFRKQDRSTAFFRTVAIGAGGPLLYALERGQLIMLTYIAMVMLYGNLITTRNQYIATAAFMANTKVYMVFPLFSLVIKRRWRLFELCGFASVALYVVTLAIVNEGTPLEIVSNLQNWFSVRLGTVWDEMLYSTTYKPFLQLDVYQFPVRDFINQEYVDAAVIFIKSYVISSRLAAFICIGLAWLYPKAITTPRLVYFILMQSFINQNPGGYAITLIAFLLLLEKARNPATTIAVIGAYLMSVPGDVPLVKLIDVTRTSWLSGQYVLSEYVAPWGALIRPGIIAIVLWALVIDSMIAFHRAMRSGPATWGLAGRYPVVEEEVSTPPRQPAREAQT
ncbi:hypothetical protein ACFQPG_04940 [Sphingomonas sp. GCM10030256]|uniref:hypothetical protein n=1 Tax=Sphingomonas sp. GCM10030256 TaxID=3273427 RepID=UPI003617D5CE